MLKDIRISLLLDFYGDVLAERRREVTSLYYNDDLSLAEIADITGISRQGVRDSIKKSESELLSLEEKLGLLRRFEELKKEISDIADTLSHLSMNDEKSVLELNSAIEKLRSLNL